MLLGGDVYSCHQNNYYSSYCTLACKVLSLYVHSIGQWHSQDELVTWAQYRHIQCAHNTHLLGELGHTPAMNFFPIIHSEIASEILWPQIATILSVLPVCTLHVHMKAISHANNWSLTFAFYIIFTQHQ